MTAADHLSGAQFKYEPPNAGARGTSRYGAGNHSLQVTIPAPTDLGIGGRGINVLPKGTPVKAGEMTWAKGGKVLDVTVDHVFQRQGVGTALWKHAHELAASNARIPRPKHSNDRTNAGDAFAHSVGGRLPRKVREYND